MLAHLRPVFRLALVIALLPALAAAEDGPLTLSSQDEWLNRIAFRDLKSDLAYSVHASVGAQAGRVTGVQANAGGEIAWDVGPCKALVAGGEGAQDNEQSSGSLWGGFCIPFPMNRFEFVLRTDYLLQPSLSSAPIALRARYSGISVQLKNTFIGWRDDDVEHAIIPLDVTMGTFLQEGVDTGGVTFELSAYKRIRSTGRVIEVLPWAYRAAGPAIPAASGGMYLSAHAQEVSPFKITRTSAGSLGPFEVEADFAAGLAYGKLTDPPAAGSAPETPAPIRSSAYDLYADATLRATRGEDTFSLRLRRAFEPTYTDEILLDTRVEASWLRVHGKHTMLLGGFGATTRRMDKMGATETTPSGGFRAAYVYRLPKHLQLTLAGEVARSFYAALDDTRASDAAWVGQSSAQLAFAR